MEHFMRDAIIKEWLSQSFSFADMYIKKISPEYLLIASGQR